MEDFIALLVFSVLGAIAFLALNHLLDEVDQAEDDQDQR